MDEQQLRGTSDRDYNLLNTKLRCLCCEEFLTTSDMGGLCSKCRTDETINGDFEDIEDPSELALDDIEEISQGDLDDLDSVLA